MTLTPKEQYEAKKAERRGEVLRNSHADFDIMLLLIERFAVAAERIADAFGGTQK